MTKIYLPKTRRQSGFTIVELMIATAILSTILLLVTSMMLGIGRLYDKGVNQARVQDSTRSITDEVSKQLELSASVVTHGVDTTTAPSGVPINVYCIGNTRYSYVQNVQIGHQRNDVGSTYYYDVLWRDVPASGCNPNIAADVTASNLSQNEATAGATNASELVPPNSRLTTFCIGTIVAATGACNYDTASPYTISVGIAYGSDDLLCDTSVAGDCNTPTVTAHMMQIFANTINVIPPGRIACKGITGNQFCAVASLSTTVANRL